MAADDNAIISFGADIQPLLRDISRGDKAIQGLLSNIAKIGTQPINPATEKSILSLDKAIERVSQAKTTRLRSLYDDSQTSAQLKKTEDQLKRIEATLDRLASKRSRITAGPSAGPDQFIQQITGLPSFQKLSDVGVKLGSTKDVLSDPGTSQEIKRQLTRYQKRYETMVSILRQRVETDIKNLAAKLNVAQTDQLRALQEFGALAGVGGGTSAAFQKHSLSTLRQSAESLIETRQFASKSEFAKEVTGLRLNQMSPSQRRVISEIYGKQSKPGLASAPLAQEATRVAEAAKAATTELVAETVRETGRQAVAEVRKKKVTAAGAPAKTSLYWTSINESNIGSLSQTQLMTAQRQFMRDNSLMEAGLVAAEKDKLKIRKLAAAGPSELASEHGGIGGVFKRTALYGASAFLIYGAVAQAQKFFDTMIKMDKQLADLRKTLGGTDDDFNKLMQSATSIARTYKGSTQDVLDAMEMFSSQFKSKSALEELSKSAILFSNLSGQALKKSAETITSTIQQYELAVTSADHVTDAWANVAANASVTIGDLGDAMGAAGGAAKVAGVDFDQLNAMVATIAASTGKSGKEIGNALKRIFERTTSSESIKELNKLGVFVNKANGEFRDFGDVISELNEKWGKLNQTEQKKIAIAFSGAKQYDAFLALMNNYNQMLDLITKSTESLGEAERQNERIGQTFTKRLQLLGVEYDKLARSAGDTVLPALGKVVDLMTILLRLFSDSGKSVKIFGTALAGAFVGGGLASGVFKSLFTGIQDGKLVGSSGNRLAQRISKYAIGPTIINPDSATGGVSLISGAGRWATQNSAIFGGLAGVVGGTGIKAALTAFGVGLATVTIALAAVGTSALAVVTAYNTLKDKTDELINKQVESAKKAQQDSSTIGSIVAKLSELSAERRSITDDEDLRKFDKTTLGPVILDAIKNETVSKELPTLLQDAGLGFDRQGNLINANVESLSKFKSALDSLSLKIENLSISKGFGGQIDISENINGVTAGQQILATVAPYRERFKRIGLGNVDTSIAELVTQISSGQLTQANAEDFFNKNTPEINARFGETGQALRRGLFEIARNIVAAQRANQLTANPKLQRLKSYALEPGLTSAERARRVSLFEKYKEDINIGVIRQGLGGDPLSPLFYIQDKLPRTRRSTGVTGPGKEGGVRPQNLDITRIDFELQKSISSSANNFRIFDGAVNTVETSLNAVKQAMTDLANETEKAAGPNEELAKLNIEKEKAVIQQKISDINKDKTIIDKEQAIFAEQLKLQALDEKQAIQEINSERQKGLDILKQQYNMLLNLQDAQESIRAGVKNLVGSDLLSSSRERAVSLGQTTEIGQTGRGTLQAQREFLQLQYARQETINQKEIASAASSGPAAVRNAEVNGRNALKHIREQMRAIDKQMDDINNKTNIWTNLLQKIGESLLSRITDRFVDMGINALGNAAGGSMSGFSLFGQANPRENALNQNTAAIQALTAQIIAAKTDSHLTTTAGVAGKAEEETNRLAAQAAAKAAGEGSQSAIGKFVSGNGMQKVLSGVMTAVASAGLGYAITQGRGRTGFGGAIGGAIGGGLGSGISSLTQTSNPLISAFAGPVLGVLGGVIGSFFDKPLDEPIPELDELPEAIEDLTYEITNLEKSLNTVNETMENLINAPGNFVLPIPKGILENSITSQSALAAPLQAGGLILRSGPAFLHAGEVVTSQNDVMRGRGGSSIVNSITINGANKDPKQIAEEVISEINRNMYKQNQRGSYPGRFS